MGKTLLLLALTLIASTAHARWMTPEEADYSIDEYVSKIDIPADGRATIETSYRLKILNENGRSHLGTIRYSYSPKNMDFKVKRAEVVNGAKTYKVEKQYIADQAIRGAEAGFDDVRQVMISFPQVQVGSELNYLLNLKVIRPNIPGHYTQKFFLGENGVEKKSEYQIVSAKKLNIAVNDPFGAIEVIKDETGKKFSYTIRTKKPVFNRVFDEPRSVLQDVSLTSVTVSTAADYNDLLSDLRVNYEKGLSQELPETFAKIRDTVKDGELSEKTIGKVLALLADRVRYMGDWRAVDGALVPRSLEKIDQTQSGDCKDMSILTTKILRELGYQAWVALVHRGENPPSLDAKAPHFGFNHAIVFVQLGEKKLWLDPTNFQSYPEGVFEDIAERKAAVLRPGSIALEKIEFGPPSASRETRDTKLRLTSKGTLTSDEVLTDSGNEAISVTGALLRVSRAQLNDRVLLTLANRSDVLNFKVETPELKSRIVVPVVIKVNMERVHRPVDTSMGPAVEFAASETLKELVKLESKQRDSALRLGPPYEAEATYIYENLNAKGSQLKNCEVKSPWLEYSFKISTAPIKVVRKMTVRRFLITAAEIKTPEFIRFQEQLKQCSRSKYVAYSRR